MNTIFSYLTPRYSNLDINFFNQIEVLLPPIYKLFYETFDLELTNKDGIFYTKIIIDEKFDAFVSYIYNMNESYNHLQWDGFFTIRELIECIGVIDHIIEESNVNLLYIGTISSNYPICLGLNDGYSDKIFFPGDNIYEDGLIKFADNIFEFCKKFTFTVDPSENISPSNLYKNWNEDFWRIKPDD